MCVCKLHLHARWAVKSLVECCKVNDINLDDITNYETFLNKMSDDCEKDLNAYVSWTCTPDIKTTCSTISKKWDALKSELLVKNHPQTVPFTHFVKKQHTTKKGKETMHLEPETLNANMEFILEFLDV